MDAKARRQFVSGRLIPLLAIAGSIVFFAKPFRTGWTTPTTDFPNYYTAAVLLRQHQPLHHYYDWVWFQDRMQRAGVQHQLGAYTPQTPLTMLPMVPFAGWPVQTAKRIWLSINLVLLFAIVAMLARLSGIRADAIALLMLCGYGSLASNFVLGQYYVFLLFLVTGTFWCLQRKQPLASGFVSGVACGLKLYTGPLLLYFAAKKKWTAVFGMLAGLFAMALIAVWLFGWSDVVQYATCVLPRTLVGSSVDPYDPGSPTLVTVLWHSLMSEPQLNPHPLVYAPWVFFFLLAAVQLGLPVITVLGIWHCRNAGLCRDFACFVITIMLLSTSVGAYSFILLLLPVTLMLREGPVWEHCFAIVCYIALNAYIQPLWWFPKVCLLLLLFIVAGRRQLAAIPLRWWLSSVVLIVAASLASATLRMRDYNAEPGRRFAQITLDNRIMLASYPAISGSGLSFVCMGPGRYWLCRSHDGVVDRVPLSSDVPQATDRAVSPDRKWMVETVGVAGLREIWVENVSSGLKHRLAGGRCDNAYPAWELDSSAVVFASDCGRAYGLMALYRAAIANRPFF